MYLHKFKCIFENICDDPLEFAFLWQSHVLSLFCSAACDVWGQLKCKLQTANTHTYMHEYVLMYIHMYYVCQH